MPQSRYKQLIDHLAADIRAGRLRPGTRLPTHRDLAVRADLALVTSTNAPIQSDAIRLASPSASRSNSMICSQAGELSGSITPATIHFSRPIRRLTIVWSVGFSVPLASSVQDNLGVTTRFAPFENISPSRGIRVDAAISRFCRRVP